MIDSFTKEQAYDKLTEYILSKTNGIDLKRLREKIQRYNERIAITKIYANCNSRLNNTKHDIAL